MGQLFSGSSESSEESNCNAIDRREEERKRVEEARRLATLRQFEAARQDEEARRLATLRQSEAARQRREAEAREIERSRFQRQQRIKLYHYTTEYSRSRIQIEGVIKSSDQNTEPQHRRYGLGVYFTSYSPYDLPPDKLALNCFTHRAKHITNPGIYRRTHYVVEIDFDSDEVERISDAFDRNVYIHRGNVVLRNYVGRYKIYVNPVHPYTNP